jgi:tetratricopeptide (TPR) repeat protein
LDAWLKKANSYSELGEYEESINATDNAIELNKTDDRLWVLKGSYLVMLEKYDEAVKTFDKAIGLNPKSGSAWQLKGYTLDAQGKYDDAIKCFKKANDLDSDYWTYISGMGNTHYDNGEYVAAIKYYEAEIKEDPTNEYAWYNKANALRMLHRNSEAEAAYAKARELGYSGTMTLLEMTTK